MPEISEGSLMDQTLPAVTESYISADFLQEPYQTETKRSLRKNGELVRRADRYERFEPEEVKEGFQEGFEGLNSISDIYEDAKEETLELKQEAITEGEEILNEINEVLNGKQEQAEAIRYQELYDQISSLEHTRRKIHNIGQNISQNVIYPSTVHVIEETEDMSYIPTENNTETGETVGSVIESMQTFTGKQY